MQFKNAEISVVVPVYEKRDSRPRSLVRRMQDAWIRPIVFPASLLWCLAASQSIADERGDEIVPARFPAGAHLIEKSHFEIDGVMTASNQDQSVKIPIKLTNKSVTISQIIAERDGKPTEVVVDYATEYALTEAAGQADDGTVQKNKSAEVGVLDGKTVRYSMNDGQWNGKFPTDAELTPDIRKALENYVPPHDDTLLEQKPRRPGEKWIVGSRYLRRYAPDALKLKGQTECEYERVVRRDDRSFAIIGWNFEMEATILNSEGDEIQTKLGGSGRTWVDLATGIEERSEGKGTIVQTGRVPDVPVPVRLAGSVLIRVEARFLVPGTTAPQR